MTKVRRRHCSETKALGSQEELGRNGSGRKESIPAGRCPPLVSAFSFGGDDMFDMRSLRLGGKTTRKGTRARRDERFPGVFRCPTIWTAHFRLYRQRGFFPSIVWERCAMTSVGGPSTRSDAARRDDVTPADGWGHVPFIRSAKKQTNQ